MDNFINITNSSTTVFILQPIDESNDNVSMEGSVTSDYKSSNNWNLEYLINGVIIPSIAIFGIVGNLLNLIILSWRYNKREADVLEKGALLCLIALAVSDMLFCVVILPHMLFYKQKMVYQSRTFQMYYKVYGIYFQNVFIKTSTFLTLVVGLARYVGICHPLRARMFIGLNGVRATCILTYILWFTLMSPMLWMHSVQEYPVSNTTTMYFVDLGPFGKNNALHVVFTYVWAFLGYFIPVAVLSFCNVNLICALRQSMRFREATTRSSSANQEVSARITLTLIILIVMFMVLVSPSEVLHFILDVFSQEQQEHAGVAIMFTNVLQAINFALHFVLYCVVNVTFRNIVMAIVCAVVRGCRPKDHSNSMDSRYSHTLLHSKGMRANHSVTVTSCTFKSNGSFKSNASFCRTSISRVAENDTYLWETGYGCYIRYRKLTTGVCTYMYITVTYITH